MTKYLLLLLTPLLLIASKPNLLLLETYKYQNISSIVRDKIPSKHWKQIKHYIFEVPNTKGNLKQRLEKVKKYENKYTYQNMTKYGKPRFPVYLRIRYNKI